MKGSIYIVICNTPLNGDAIYHIDSVWTSKRKAEKQCDLLNSNEKAEWRDEYGYGIFTVELQWLSK